MSACYSDKNSGTIYRETSGRKLCLESFWKIWKLLNYCNVNRSTRKFENPGRKIKWNENSKVRNFLKIGFTLWGCPLFQKFWDVLFHSPLEIQTRILQGRLPFKWDLGAHRKSGNKSLIGTKILWAWLEFLSPLIGINFKQHTISCPIFFLFGVGGSIP